MNGTKQNGAKSQARKHTNGSRDKSQARKHTLRTRVFSSRSRSGECVSDVSQREVDILHGAYGGASLSALLIPEKTDVPEETQQTDAHAQHT